jgi:peptidoglycan/LPS O-acetylase OafA/YrhL
VSNCKQVSYLYFLDGLRGFAAIIVVLYHMRHFFGVQLPVAAGLLAVDFFFVMSGLVLEMNYGDRIRQGQTTVLQFMARRVIRLYPLFLAAAAVGMIYYLKTYRFSAGESMADVIWAAAMSMMTMLPLPLFGTGAYAFPYNGAAWSLSIEIWGSLVFAMLFVRSSNTVLFVSVLLAFLGYILAVQGSGSVDIHYKAEAWTYWAVPARFWLSFGMGMLIWRCRSRIPKAGWLLVIVGPVFLCFPGLPDNNHLRIAYVAIVFPVTVALAMNVRMGPKMNAICSHLGRMSYPLYIIHTPVLSLCAAVMLRLTGIPSDGNSFRACLLLAVVALSTGFATYWLEPRLTRAFGLLLIDRRQPQPR